MYARDNQILSSLSRLILSRSAAIGSQHGVTSILRPVHSLKWQCGIRLLVANLTCSFLVFFSRCFNMLLCAVVDYSMCVVTDYCILCCAASM